MAILWVCLENHTHCVDVLGGGDEYWNKDEISNKFSHLKKKKINEGSV